MQLDFPSIHSAFKKNKQKCKWKRHKNSDFLFALSAVDLCWVSPDNDVGSSSACLEEYGMFSLSDG